MNISMSRMCGALALAWFIAAANTSAENQAAISDLTLVGVAEADGVTYASLVDTRTGEHFLPSTRAADGGLELEAITPDQDAIIRQNGRSFLVHLGWASGTGSVANVVPRPTTVTQNIARPGDAQAAVPTRPPGTKLPLVFQSGDMKGFNLTDEQKATVLRLRQQFLATIAATGTPTVAASTSSATSTLSASDESSSSTASQTATDANALSDSAPAETQAQAWRAAQEESDEMFVMLFGSEAFNLYQMGLAPKPQL